MKKVIFSILFVLTRLVSLAGHEGSEKNTTKTVVGKITDSTGESIPGAKIIIAQTGETVYADFDGNFKLTLKTDTEFSISINTLGFEVLETSSSKMSSFSDFSLKSL
jgi:hypothetical protein